MNFYAFYMYVYIYIYKYDLADLGFYDLRLNLYLKILDPQFLRRLEYGKINMVSPFTQDSGHSVGGVQKFSDSKAMAAWPHGMTWMSHLVTSIYVSHVVPRDKYLFVTKSFLCAIHRNYFFIFILKPKCWVDDNSQMSTKHQA